MKTQRSRHTHRPSQRYSAVYQQQGRMLTDADWNELSDLVKHRLSDVLQDVIGSGTPRGRGLIAEASDGTASLQWGQVYLDGIVGKVVPDPAQELSDPLEKVFEYDKQLDFPDTPPLPAEDTCLYLDLWERTVTFFEDPELRDPALHGADTCTRTQTMVQVKWAPVGIDPEDESLNPKIGSAPLSLELREGNTSPDPCDPCAQEISLDQKIGNYLFRVEVHDVTYQESGAPQQVTLKWSSENGAEHYEVGSEPKGFIKQSYIYDFFSSSEESFASEKHLGRHLNGGSWEPTRSELHQTYPDVLPTGKSFVRRWDGAVTLEKIGSEWILVGDQIGVDRGVEISGDSAATAPGHFSSGAEIEINLDALILTLSLGDEALLAGDFWEATVRSAVHEAGDLILDAALPQGIEHHYLKLGTLGEGGFIPDHGELCRQFLFPPLTDIQADDVCYDNGVCEIPGVDTVKDALDHLCEQKDLRWHNKHLHGWGVVCGLRVYCAPRLINDEGNEADQLERRQSIRVQKGYALDCEGNDIVVDSLIPLNVIDQVQQLDQVTPNDPILIEGKGTVCLSIALDPETGDPSLEIEKYTETKTSVKSLLEGTLLYDFFDDCILGLLTDLKDEVDFSNVTNASTAVDSDIVVGMQRRRFVSAIHLFIQLFEQTHGRYLLIPHNEHLILRQFYETLREKIQSNTYCAMFRGLDFPEYPFPPADRQTTTFFGKNGHTKVLVAPDQKHVFTYGGANRFINIFDTEKKELVNIVEMQAGEGAEIQAIVFTPDGKRLYAAATLREDDTILGFADIDGPELDWRRTTVVCDVDIVAMEMSTEQNGLIYAIGQGDGLYLLRHDALFDDVEKPVLDPAFSFPASGHLSVDEKQRAVYATALGSEVEATGSDFLYDRFVILNLDQISADNTDSLPPTIEQPLGNFDIPMLGEDGFALGAQEANGRAFHIATNEFNGSGTKMILTYGLTGGFQVSQSFNTIVLENTPLSLHFHQGLGVLLVSLAASFRVLAIEPSGTKPVSPRIPVQIHPEEMATNQKGDLYVLNFASNTVTEIPVDEILVDQDFLNALSTYRRDAIIAFLSLFGGLLQYLKDCFCEKLLVNCPECDEEDKVYLGVVEIRNNEVEKICNFAKRKDVKTFPKVEYWFSLIPVLPLLKKAVEKVCCLAMPNFLQKFTPNILEALDTSPLEDDTTTGSKYPAQTVAASYQTVQRTDIRGSYTDFKNNASAYGKIGLDSVAAQTQKKSFKKNSGLKKTSLINSDLEAAKAEMQRREIIINEVKPYQPNSTEALTRFRRTPTKLPKGAKVDVYQKDGKVMYYAISEEVRAPSRSLAEEDAAVKKMKAAVSELKAEREAEDARLKILLEEKSKIVADFQKLNQDMAAISATHRELKLAVAKDRPVKDVSGVDPKVDLHLRELGIRNVDELAKAKVNDLSKGNLLSRTDAETIIKRAQKKLNIDAQ